MADTMADGWRRWRASSVEVPRLGALLVAVVGASFGGCATPNHADFLGSAAIEPLANEPMREYVLRRGDVIDVKFFYEARLNERVTIRPDGRISLQLVDEVDAAGLTPAELDEILTARYSHFLKEAEVAVIVRESAGQKVYVGGEVALPGIVFLGPQMTAMEAIVDAGGFRETAEPRSVIIISRSPNNTRLVRRVDLIDYIEGSGETRRVLLRPFDVVHVPKSAIAEANKFVDQYIRRMIPGNLSAGFNYTVVRSTQSGTITNKVLPP